MIKSCEDLQKIIQPLALVKECDVLKNGALRIATPFRYPDGSHIDVILSPISGLLGTNIIGDYHLSDGGQTSDYVANLRFDLTATKKRRELIDDICQTLNVKFSDDAFGIYVEKKDLQQLPQAIARLAQACIRASDLIYTQRFQVPGTFQDEIEEFLFLKEFEYEPDFSLRGDYQKLVKVEFKVLGRTSMSLMQTLSEACANKS